MNTNGKEIVSLIKEKLFLYEKIFCDNPDINAKNRIIQINNRLDELDLDSYFKENS